MWPHRIDSQCCAVSSNRRTGVWPAMTILPSPRRPGSKLHPGMQPLWNWEPRKRDCRVDELESSFPLSLSGWRVRANLDEMDYLARRLDSFDKYEAAQFQAMAVFRYV